MQRAGLTFTPPEAVLALDKLATRFQNLERSPNWCKDWEDRLREQIQSVSAVRKNKGKYYSWELMRSSYVIGMLKVRSGDSVSSSIISALPYLNVVKDEGLLLHLSSTSAWGFMRLIFQSCCYGAFVSQCSDFPLYVNKREQSSNPFLWRLIVE